MRCLDGVTPFNISKLRNRYHMSVCLCMSLVYLLPRSWGVDLLQAGTQACLVEYLEAVPILGFFLADAELFVGGGY